ncbi:MAG TPA: hypothetical protein VFB80_15555, partial [Pirellulaceae bacterium]|nr:hypothetical protein [Pirellulaceae bacterium]
APVQLAATGMQGAALSGDGSLLAVPSPAPAPALGTAVVNVYSTREPNLPDEFTTELWSADWVALSADGSRLAVLGHDAAECYDVKTKRRTGRIPVDVRPIAPSMLPTFMRGYRRGSEAALSPDGSRLATYKGGQITLYDLPSSKIAYTLTGGPRAIQIVIFTLGFAAWAAGWGIVAKRERLRQPPAAPREEARPAATRPVPTVQSPWRSIGSALIWVIMIAAFLAVFSTVGRALSLRFVLDMLLTLLGGLAAVVAIIFVYFWLARLFMGPHYFTLLRLRQVSGGVGRTFPQGDVQFWFAAPSPYEGHQVGQVFDEARQRARELFGDDGPRSVPATLVAWLDRQCELDAFVGRATPVPAIVPNIWRGNSAVVCEETALRRFGHPLTALRAALALMFAIRRKRGLLPGYVGGLVSRELCWDEESPADVRAAARRLKLLLARCPDFSPQRVLLRPPNERRDLWFTLDLPESWREVRAEVDLLATLHPLLFGTTAPAGRRERVLAWLRAIKPKDDPLATMKQAAGLSLDELLAEWRAWLDSADTTYDSPSSERQAQLQTLIVRQILDRSQPALDRAKAARNLGGTSFVGAAGSLISLLSDPRCEFRGEVVDALENLSGLPLGDDLVAWQAWWTALPAELRWQTAEPPIVAELVEKAGAACALGSPSEVLAAKPNLPAPVELKVVWGLMAIGGLTALAIPITFLFVVGPLVFVTIYLSLIVGVRAMIFGAARETQGLAGVAKLQMLNIIACDPINLLLATLEQTLLRRPNVQEYLAQAGGR